MSQACAVSSPVSWGFERNGDITTVCQDGLSRHDFGLKWPCVYAAISFACLPRSHCCVYWIHSGRTHGVISLPIAETQGSIPKRRCGRHSRVGWILHWMVYCSLDSLAKYHHLLRRQDPRDLHDEPLPASIFGGVRCCDASSCRA